MGSKTYEGVRFSVYSDDHEPPHVHGTTSDVTLILDLLSDGTVRMSDRKHAVDPANAPKNVQAKIRRVAAENVEELIALWEKTHGHGRDITTEADIDAAMERARNEPELPHALFGEYKPDADVIVLHINNGRRLLIPREELQGLEDATPEQIAHIEIFGGLDVAWPDLDLDHYLPSLMQGIYGSDSWMQALREKWAQSIQRPMFAA